MSQNTCRDASKHGTGAAGEQQQGQVDHVNPKRNPNYIMHGHEKNLLKKKAKSENLGTPNFFTF